MDKGLQALDAGEREISFQNDTKLLGRCTADFVSRFFPSYGIAPSEIENLEKEDSLALLNSFRFYRLTECTVDDIDDLFPFFASKMQKLFTTAYSIKQEVCYGIVSHEGETALIIGIAPTSKDTALKTVIEGLLPGMKLKEYSGKFVNLRGTSEGNKGGYDKDRYVGCVSGIPALKIDGKYQNKDISSLMRSLNGENYTILVLCKPLDESSIQDKMNAAIDIQDKCFGISKRTVSMQQGSSDSRTYTTQHSETDGSQENKTKSHNVSGAGMGIAGAGVGAAVGSVVPGVGTVIGALGGGLIGLLAGKQFSFNKSKTTGTSHSVTDGYSDAVTESVNKSGTISGEVQNGYAVELMKMSEKMIERLKTGRSIGMWKTLITYSSDSETTSKIIQGSLYSEVASGIPDVLPPIVFSYKDSCYDEKGNIKNIHAQQAIIPKGFMDKDSESPLCSFLTSEELCGICTIPIDNTVGFEIRKAKGYSINSHADESDIIIGKICEYERVLGHTAFGISEDDLNKHTFVCGITGSGKTNTVKQLLESVDKPFLVIEPAKKEYRNMKKDVRVYTLGRPEINCLRINPFYIIRGISPQQHIDYLKDLFCASFGLYGPMPYILEKCLYNVYRKKGWNLTLGFHPCLTGGNNADKLFDDAAVQKKYAKNAHRYLFPTMQDLKDEVDYYVEHFTDYEGDVKGNIRSAIIARIDSLCVGSKGYMFNTSEMADLEQLLSKNTVLELEGLADDADKAFSLGLLIMLVNEFRQVKKELGDVHGLEHLLVIEEAHRLLKNVSDERNEDVGNPKGKAVEHFTNMLAEMRSYGQGVIVAEQIPSKLAPDVIKNSSNKIIHRLVALDDQETVANTIGVKQEDAIHLGNQKPGYALCHKEGMVQPVLVKIKEVEKRQVSDIRLYDRDLENKLFAINKSIIANELPKEISVWAVKTLVTLMAGCDAEKLYEGLKAADRSIDKQIVLKAITLIPGVDKRRCIISVIGERMAFLLTSGVFGSHTLPEDDFLEKMWNTIEIPADDKIKELSLGLERFYKKKPSTKAAEIVAALVSEEYSQGYDVDSLIKDFMLYEDEKFIRAVKGVLER